MTLDEKIAALPEWPEKPGQSTVFNDTQYDLERMRWYRDRLALAREWIEEQGHRMSCEYAAWEIGTPCTCGRDALLAALEGPCKTYDKDGKLLTICHNLATAERERDEAVRKYEERVRQHEEYIAFADEEITGLIEKKRMVLVSLDEAVALLREIVAWRVAIECVAPELGGVATTLSRIDAFIANLEVKP